MQKQAPSFGRILTMVLFALSCFGLLLFLWLSFGGSIPLKPANYRVKVAFPEATQLGLEADVRVAGVSVGKVRGKELDPNGGNRTVATLELDRRFAPLHSDARAILRQKTLLGETYVELTPGTRRAPTIKEGGQLANGQVQPTVELDELLQAFDPGTRQAFHIWQQELARTITNRGQDFSDALGNLPAFSTDATALLKVLNDQSSDLTKLVRNTGTVFEALSRNSGQLHNLITNSEDTFHATAAQNEALATTFSIFPTFLRESRLTFTKLQAFALNTDPLIRDLKPVAHDLRPTLHSVRLLAPDLRRLFNNLDPLIKVSKQGLPALRDTLRGLGPNGLLDQTGPFLSQLNPILQFLELYQKQVSDFIGQGKGAVAGITASATGGIGHYLRQIGPFGPETVSTYSTRPNIDRGNSYPTPPFISGREWESNGIFPNWDCKPSGGEVQGSATPPAGQPPNQGTPPCWVAPTIPFQGQNQRYPHVNAADYTK
jgi:phospholipid/cholesterol/gamma-HCH transport system substrate-binding protein